MATHISSIETSISRLNETAYGTARASGDDYRRILNDAQTVATREIATQNDAGYDNGSDLPSETWNTTISTDVTLTPDLCFEDIGFLLKDALGGYAVSGPDGGLYTHVFTGQNMASSRQLPSRTILKKLGGLGLYLYRSCVNTQWSISCPEKIGRLKTSFQYMGQGYYAIDPASYASPAVVADREYAYAPQAKIFLNQNGEGTSQVETATAAGTITGAGNATVVVTGANISGSPITLSVAVANTDTASAWAAKVRTAIRANKAISEQFACTGSGTSIILTDRRKRANDGTLNISLDNGTCTGITTAASSANTTAGVVGDEAAYSCALENWSIGGSNPPADPGYRICSEFVTADNPQSGQYRSELLCGARTLTFDFTARLESGDKMQGWLTEGAECTLLIPILGRDTADKSLIITHNKARVTQANPMTGAGGDFIGITGQCELLSTSGDIGLTCTLVNAVASYSS